MSIYDTEFSRRLRSSAPHKSKRSKDRDVFGDVEPASPRGMSPATKSKVVVRDYGDRYVVKLASLTPASSLRGIVGTSSLLTTSYPSLAAMPGHPSLGREGEALGRGQTRPHVEVSVKRDNAYWQKKSMRPSLTCYATSCSPSSEHPPDQHPLPLDHSHLHPDTHILDDL